MNLNQIIIIYFILINVVSFFLMALDKWKAIRKTSRISEKTLFLAAVIGGALGASISMNIFHHKTRHWYFKVGFYSLTIIQVVLLLKLMAA